MSTENKVVKRKRARTKNTTINQYNIYVQFMENDYHFRSNTINPTLEADYLDKKWKELANLLNADGDGPQLQAEEWKKRFVDWKYAVKMKYRKLVEHRNKTGSGPQSDIKLSVIEERALSVWGKVTVEGVPSVTSYEGISLDSNVEIVEVVNSTEENLNLNEANENTPIIVNTIECESTQQIPEKKKIRETPKKKTGTRQKPLSVLTENLLSAMEKNEENFAEVNKYLKNFLEQYVTIKQEKNNIELLKLKFQVEKYKFENPQFEFEYVL